MKTTVNEIKRSLVFLVCALVAAAFSGCTNDDAVQTPQPTDGDIVQVTAQVASSELAFTRGADGLNDATSKFSLLTTESASSKLNISVDNGSGAYSNFAYSITGASTIAAPATPPYFPAGVNTVHVYGWYPENGGSSTFTVQANQQAKDAYCLSDVMVAQPAECTRSLVSEAWNVTAASLTFNHIMSKIKVVVAPTAGVTITGVRLLGIKPTVALNIPAGASPSITAGSAQGDAGTITLLSGGSLTSSSSEADRTLCGVFPPDQSLSGNFMEIDASIGGLSSTITYTLGASSKTFSGNRQYNITATVGAILTDETVDVSGWASKTDEPLEVTVGAVTDPAAMDKTAAKMAKNPLFYVAQYNLATIKGANNLAGTAATETTFCTSHNIMGSNTSPALMFTQTDARRTISGGTGALSGWHLPDVKEQIAVVPSNSTTASGPNIWGLTSSDASTPGTMAEAECTIHGTNVTSPINSIFLCVGNGNGATTDPNYHRYYEHYAVRFINTEYASAWHYVWTGNGMVIESYMLATVPTTEAEAKKVLAALPKSSAWQATRNYSPETTADGTTTLCYRYLPACGSKNTGTGAADNYVGIGCWFWSSSQSGDSGFNWSIDTNSGNFAEYLSRSTFGLSVRLFHD